MWKLRDNPGFYSVDFASFNFFFDLLKFTSVKHSRKGYKMLSEVHRHDIVENPVPRDSPIIV